ncbi:MAG: hypothetical protein ACREEO_09765, partial [Phenylobacterium sp.]
MRLAELISALSLALDSKATVRGIDLGEMGPVPERAQLRDFVIPRRGIVVVVARGSRSTATDRQRLQPGASAVVFRRA